MTVHPGLVPGMPRFLNATSFVMRSAAVVKTTTLVKSAQVIGVARNAPVELSEGGDPVAGTLVTATIDLQKCETGGGVQAVSTEESYQPRKTTNFFSRVSQHSEYMLEHRVTPRGVSL